MRKTICILSLVAITVLASASDVFAQRVRVGVGGRRGGVSVNVGRGYYGGYYDNRYYGGYYRTPYYYGNRYYYTNPGYYYSDFAVQLPPTEIRQSFYSDPNVATITVIVPNPDAQVWFDDAATSQRGMERLFHTPALQQTGTYSIKARWTENGRTVYQERQVQVQPGQSVTVNFQANFGERLSSPLPKN